VLTNLLMLIERASPAFHPVKNLPLPIVVDSYCHETSFIFESDVDYFVTSAHGSSHQLAGYSVVDCDVMLSILREHDQELSTFL